MITLEVIDGNWYRRKRPLAGNAILSPGAWLLARRDQGSYLLLFPRLLHRQGMPEMQPLSFIRCAARRMFCSALAILRALPIKVLTRALGNLPAEAATGLLWRQGSYSDPEPGFMREPPDNDVVLYQLRLSAQVTGK